MLSSRIHTRRISTLGLLFGLILGLFAWSASPAFAHDELLSSDPADGDVVATVPEAITLTFSGILLDGEGATQMSVTDADGNDLTEGDPVLDGVRVRQPLGSEASGLVQVAWRVVSSDGHPISGEYSFSVGDSAAPAPSDSAAPAPDGESAELLPVWISLGVLGVLAVVIVVVLTRRQSSRED